MTVELVKAIKEAEVKAESIVREAKQEARQAQKAAEVKAAVIMQKALAEAEKKAEDLIRKAEDDARSEAVPLIEERQQEIVRLKKEASGRLPEVVAVITEKVVNIYADN